MAPAILPAPLDTELTESDNEGHDVDNEDDDVDYEDDDVDKLVVVID